MLDFGDHVVLVVEQPKLVLTLQNWTYRQFPPVNKHIIIFACNELNCQFLPKIKLELQE